MVHKVAAQVIAARFREIRAASTAGGGTALTTTAKAISLPLGSDWVSITARNLVGADVVRFALNPFLAIIKTSDGLGLLENLTDLSREMQDGDTTDTAFDSFTTTDNIYVGAGIPFRGVDVDIGSNAQSAAEVLTVKYWNGHAWIDLSDSDGTETGGNTTMAVDGAVTWSIPSAWARESLVNAEETSLLDTWARTDLYWTRWEIGGATNNNWDIAQMRSLNRSTAYAELIEGQTYQQAISASGPGSIITVEALTDSGTANLVINVATELDQEFD